jgi:hypothetical protein
VLLLSYVGVDEAVRLVSFSYQKESSISEMIKAVHKISAMITPTHHIIVNIIRNKEKRRKKKGKREW